MTRGSEITNFAPTWKEITINHKERRMAVKEKELTWISNDELEKFKINFSRSENRDIAPLMFGYVQD